jgi:hypothetical protein
MRKTGRHCEAAQPTKQSMFIIALRSSGLLRFTRNDDKFVTMITKIAQVLPESETKGDLNSPPFVFAAAEPAGRKRISPLSRWRTPQLTACLSEFIKLFSTDPSVVLVE